MEAFFSSNLFRLSYWFTLSPAPLSIVGQRVFLGLFIIVFLVGIGGRILATRYQVRSKLITRVYRKLGALGLTMGLWGFLLWFFFFEGVYLLAGRFWFLVWGIIFLVWGGKIFYLARVKLPQQEKTVREQEEFEKYLPRPRHSR